MKTCLKILLLTILALSIVLQVHGRKNKESKTLGKRKQKLIGNAEGTQEPTLFLQGWDEYGIPRNITIPTLKKILEYIAEYKRMTYCPYSDSVQCTNGLFKAIVTKIVADVIKNATAPVHDDDDYSDELSSNSYSKHGSVALSMNTGPKIKIDGKEVAPEDVDKKIHEEYPKRVPKVSVDDEDLDPADIAMAEEFSRGHTIRNGNEHKTKYSKYEQSEQKQKLSHSNIQSDLANLDPNEESLLEEDEDMLNKIYHKIRTGKNIFLKNLLKQYEKYAEPYVQNSSKTRRILMRNKGGIALVQRKGTAAYNNFHVMKKFKHQKYIKNMGPFKGTLVLRMTRYWPK